jgi:hypothetical protein
MAKIPAFGLAASLRLDKIYPRFRPAGSLPPVVVAETFSGSVDQQQFKGVVQTILEIIMHILILIPNFLHSPIQRENLQYYEA